MTALADGIQTLIEGKWNIAWLRTMSPRTEGLLTLTVNDDVLLVELDTPLGSVTAEGTFDGVTLAWSTVLADEPLRFEATVAGDELYGAVHLNFRIPIVGTSFSLEGVRAAKGNQVRRRLGSEALGESLRKSGIEYVFGAPGSRWMPSPHHGITAVAARTEVDAAWMSYGYNRAKRRAASATSLWGVGVMHASPVVYAAKQDSTPLVFLSWEQAIAWDMRDIVQESTQLYSTLKPISKYAKRLVHVEDLPIAVRQAVLASSTGKPGPTVLSITDAILHDRTTIPSEELVLPSGPAAREQDVTAVFEAIAKAKTPVLLAGAGVHMADAAMELRTFAESVGIPVVTSGVGGRGVLPDDHPLYAGDTWNAFPTGIKVAEEADLWISIGFSYSQSSTHWWSLKKPSNVIQVDIEPNQLGRIFQPSLGIIADAKAFLDQLNSYVETARLAQPDYLSDPRIVEIQEAKRGYFEVLKATRGTDPILVPAIGQILSDELPEDAMIVVEDGRVMAGMVFRESKYPAGFASAMGYHYACMGSALPVAIGVKLAEPNRTVICFGSDGGLYYDCGELSLLAQENIKIVVIINNNNGIYSGERGPTRMSSPFGGNPFNVYSQSNFASVANGFGVEAEQVDKYEDFTPALRRALAAEGPYVIDVITGDTNLQARMPESLGIDLPRKYGRGYRSVDGSWPS